MTGLTVGSLFSGIGGLELGLEWAGLGPVRWQVEIDPWCRQVLAKHWPEARRYADVRSVGVGVLEPVDIICGGFPCQDLSLAGRGAGLAGERSGLWFEYRRILDEFRPRGVIIENVGGLVRRGLDVVVGGLCDLGYTVEATRLRAADVGAPHRRERVFIVAVADADGSRRNGRPGRGAGATRGREPADRGREGVANADCARGLQQGGALGEVGRWPGYRGREGVGDPCCSGLEVNESWPAREQPAALGAGGGDVGPGAAKSSMGGGADGLSTRLDGPWPAGRGEPQHEWEPPRTARGIPDRSKRVKALGNAVVPQCAYVAGARLRDMLGARNPPSLLTPVEFPRKGDSMITAPRRRFEIAILVQADTWDEAMRALDDMGERVKAGIDLSTSVVVGGATRDWSLVVNEDPTVTNDSYFAAVTAWKGRKG